MQTNSYFSLLSSLFIYFGREWQCFSLFNVRKILHVNTSYIENTNIYIYTQTRVLKKFFSLRHVCSLYKRVVIYKMRIKTKTNRVCVVTSILFDIISTMYVTACISKFFSFHIVYRTAYVWTGEFFFLFFSPTYELRVYVGNK